MNFVEYLSEARKYEFVLYNKKERYAPKYEGEEFYTWAVSDIKAYYQIIYRLKRNVPSYYMREIHHNPDDFIAMDAGIYRRELERKREAKLKREPVPEPPPPPKKPHQTEMFPRGMPD